MEPDGMTCDELIEAIKEAEQIQAGKCDADCHKCYIATALLVQTGILAEGEGMQP